MEYASVDLPEPLGPMIACVSPERTVRSTPRRISLVPCSVSTVTCRSRISRVAMRSVLLAGDDGAGVAGRGVRCAHVDQDDVALDGEREDGARPGRGQAGGLAGAQVEARAVQPALDRAVLDLALGQRDLGVRAGVVDGVQ